MLTTAFSLALCLGAPAPLASAVSADNILWLEVPDAAQSLARLEGSPRAPLAALFAPRSLRKGWQAFAPLHSFLTLHRGSAALPYDPMLWLDAGAGATALAATLEGEAAQYGLARVGEPRDISGMRLVRLAGAEGEATLCVGEGRVGLGRSAARCEHALEAAPRPLVSVESYGAETSAAPDADLRARLDVQQLYGSLARRPDAALLAGVIERLGLHTARALGGSVRLDGPRGPGVHFNLAVLGEDHRGLRYSLGPGILAASVPASLAKATAARLRVSLYPARAYDLVHLLAAYLWPMQAALARSHLEATENRVGKRVATDILGESPRVYMLELVMTREGRLSPILVAPLADAAAGEAFVRAMGETLVVLEPSAAFVRTKLERGVAYTVKAGRHAHEVTFALAGGVLFVGPDARLVGERARRGAASAVKGDLGLDAAGAPVAAAGAPAGVAADLAASTGLAVDGAARGGEPVAALLQAAGLWQAALAAVQRDGGNEAALLLALGAAQLGVTSDGAGLHGDVRW